MSLKQCNLTKNAYNTKYLGETIFNLMCRYKTLIYRLSRSSG